MPTIKKIEFNKKDIDLKAVEEFQLGLSPLSLSDIYIYIYDSLIC